MIGDHYVVNKSHSHFIYQALERTTGFALTRKFLHNYIFLKYPDIEVKVKAEAYLYFQKFLFTPINEHRQKEISEINHKKSITRTITVT